MLKKFVLFIFLFLFATASVAKPLTLILDWFINPDHAPIFVAKQQGYFKQAGIQLKIVPPAEPSDATKLVAAGKADVGITYQPGFMIAVSQGLPLVRIGTLVNSPLNCMIVLKSGPIKNLSDLKGKTIGYSTGGVDNVMLKTMLHYHGLSLKDVHLVSFHYGQTQALLSHRVDAITGQMRNFELPEMKLLGQPARAFYPENNGMPSYDELIFVTSKQELKNPADKAMLKKFVAAVGKGVRYLKKHPVATWKVFAKNHPALDNKLNHETWMMSVKYFDPQPAQFSKQRYLKYAAFLQKEGLIKQMPALSSWAQVL